MTIGKNLSRRDFLKTTATITAGAAVGGLVDPFTLKSAVAASDSETVKVVMASGPQHFDVHTATGGNNRSSAAHIFEGLIDYDFKPRLATSWENPDENTCVFHLKEGVEFTNGEPFTASVAKFNFDRIRDPKLAATYYKHLKPVQSIDVLDKYTLKIQTKSPDAGLFQQLRLYYMMSPKAIKEYDKDIARYPVGTGPYMVKEVSNPENVTMVANPNYHGSKETVKSLNWRAIPEPATRISELKSGYADIINKIPPELAGTVEGKGTKTVRKRSEYRMGIKFHCGKPPFDNVKVRQAMNYATNKAELIKYVLRGAGYETAGYIGPQWGDAHNPNLEPYPYDPKKAKQLLSEAGHPNGVDFEIVTPHGRYLKDKELVEAIAYQVKESGFRMKVKVFDWQKFLKNYDNSNGYFIGQGYFLPQVELLIDAYSPANYRTSAHYHSDAFNKLFEKTKETFDMGKRNAMYQELSKILWEDAIYCFLYDAQDIYGVSTRIKGFTPRADSWIILKNLSL